MVNLVEEKSGQANADIRYTHAHLFDVKKSNSASDSTVYEIF